MATPPEIKHRIHIRTEERIGRYYVEDLGNGVQLKMVSIPSGRFLMGSPLDELERLDHESPQHEVHLGDFFMSMYPVTQAQWRAVATHIQEGQPPLPLSPSNFKGDDRPVENISWYEAVEFCDRLSAKTKRPYRLPTEAEWEYACRANTQTPFHFGETITTDLANYDGADESYGAYGRGVKGVYRKETTNVGSFPANAFGLYDMHGNVLEWCMDHWHNSYADKPEALKVDGHTPWLATDEQDFRLLRGGSWFNNPVVCRSAYRYYILPGVRTDAFGFRIVSRAARTLF